MSVGLLALTSGTLAPAFAVLVAGTVLSIAASLRRWDPVVPISIALALGLRIAMACVARGHTPHDVESYFHTVATVTNHGRDALEATKRFEWNFLPVMPYVWAALLHLHLSWDVTVRIPAIVADGVNTVLVAALAPTRKRLRAFQYAANPLACLVAGWHGQIEPVALTCGLLALFLLRRRSVLGAGAIVGLGIAIKTWPALFAVAILRTAGPARWPKVVAVLVAVPAAAFLTMALFLHAHLGTDARIILGYRSYVGQWGWTGVVRLVRGRSIAGYTGVRQVREQHIGAVLFGVVLVGCLWLWRRAEPEVLMLGLLLVFLVTTAGFGIQYIAWPLPLAVSHATKRTWIYIVPASAYAAYVYLGNQTVRGPILWSLPVIVGIIVALPIDQLIAPVRAGAR